jgi:hypothetical protein
MLFGTRSTVDAAMRIDARHQAEIKAWWRDWHRYLKAQLQLLDARQSEATHAPNFERTEQAWEQQRAEAEQTLKRIPHDRRVVFDRARDARRGEVQALLESRHQSNGASQRAAVDPDVVERETLTALLKQAEGIGEGQDRWGAVPMPQGWYELQVEALLHAPAAAEYSVTLDDADERRKRWALIAALLLFGVIAVWWTWPRGATTAAEELPPPVPMINGQEAQPWQVVRVSVIDSRDIRTTLTVTSTDALVWPTTPEASAWWRSTNMSPPELCVPSSILAEALSLEVWSSGDAPVRSYSLHSNTLARTDLVVSPCTPDSKIGPRYGRLVGVAAHPDHLLDTPVSVGANGPVLRVKAIEVIGAGQDPQLPSDKYRVVVRVSAPSTVDWVALDPRLVLQTGLETIPSAPVNVSNGQDTLDVIFLVPAFFTPLEAAWYITEPDTHAQLRWRVKLDPPRSRADVLRDSLELGVTGQRGIAPNTATVTIRLRNTSASTLMLKEDDVSLMQQDRKLAVTSLGTVDMLLAPHEVRSLTLPLNDIDWTREVSVSIGTARFRLRF